MKTDILIIGGGLSGLALAWQLEQKGQDYILVEARERYGGRIHSEKVSSKTATGHFDLGPAWFWPGQPRIAKIIREFDLKPFDQYFAGALSYEDEYGHVQRGRGFASMQGSYRLTGSLTALIDAYVNRLPNKRLFKNHKVTSLNFKTEITARAVEAKGKVKKLTAQKVVLALPPRVINATIKFSPDISNDAHNAMRNTSTWMAGHAKVVAVYDRPFWREVGLSGDAMSRRGPMIEIHDASASDDGPYALFGFLGTPVQTRKDHKDTLQAAARDQLIRLFGPQAGKPLELILQDWAFEPETATSLDHAPLSHHPDYGLPSALDGLWDNRLIMGSSEVAPQFGGYLEGALEAAENAFTNLNSN